MSSAHAKPFRVAPAEDMSAKIDSAGEHGGESERERIAHRERLVMREETALHVRGVLSMARAMDPDSAGSQFFIMLGDAPFLDGKYTTFGQLIKGDDVLTKISKTPTTMGPGGEPSKPTERVEIKSIQIVPKAKALGTGH